VNPVERGEDGGVKLSAGPVSQVEDDQSDLRRTFG
jgi:hypothetical protein